MTYSPGQGSSQPCYHCPKSRSMEECDSARKPFNCSQVGSFQSKCSTLCDWKKAFYMRSCAIDHMCDRLRNECKEREAMQDKGNKAIECEFQCCEGNLCNINPCSLGYKLVPRLFLLGLLLLFLFSLGAYLLI